MLNWLRRRNAPARVAVIESLPVDGKRSVILVRRDNIEHLVMVGGRNDLVIEPNIMRRPAPNPVRRPALKRSTLIDVQKTAITALKIQVETLKARLKWATNNRDVQNLENRLAEQSRRLNQNEFELKYLRSEVKIAQKAEADAQGRR
jgi:Flagellar biosynthesis protein, FliO